MISSAIKSLLNRSRYYGYTTKLGDELDKKLGVLVAKYDFAIQGGAVGSIQLVPDLLSLSEKSILPDNAIIKNVVIDIVTPMASSGGAATIALTAQSAGDLLAAVDADTLSNQVQGIPNNVVANMIKLTADRTITAVIAVEALTAGKVNVYIEYVLSE